MHEDSLRQQTEESPPPQVSDSPGEGISRAVLAMLTGVVLVGAVLTGLLTLNRRQTERPPRILSPQAREYAEKLEFLGLTLSAADNIVGSQIVYLDGVLANRGDHTVTLLRLRLDFQDTLGQVILRQERELIPLTISPVAPGEARQFQFRFDYPPASWNIQPPELGILSLVVE
jgi:hypothetical protein